MTTKPADRIRIAREFNGLSSEPPSPGTCSRPSDTATTPKYDVVIANSVAYEGVDLQVRTCTIHHLDLPWTPADLEQRNGRAVRQGNTLGTVHIYYRPIAKLEHSQHVCRDRPALDLDRAPLPGSPLARDGELGRRGQAVDLERVSREEKLIVSGALGLALAAAFWPERRR